MQIDKEIDTSGLTCPLPVLRLKQALKELESGQRLKVIATDPGSQKDFQAYADQTGHKLLSSSVEEGSYIYVVEKR